MTHTIIPSENGQENQVGFTADTVIMDRVIKIIGKRDVKHGLDSAIEACAGALAGVQSYLIATFGLDEGRKIFLDAANRTSGAFKKKTN
jgi:hypothetical protein